MHVRRLELVDFRSYPRVEVDFAPGVSVLTGPNGIGKTNLVEALGYVATLSSHRVATDAPLVRTGAATAVVRCVVVHEDRELLVELEIAPGRGNRARLGRSPVRRVRDVVGALRLVLFAPEDLELVRGEPAARRRYLDDLLVARQPRFAGVVADYERVLKQRNALLRTAVLARRSGGTADLSTLDVWDTHLARHGGELLAGRLDLVAGLAPYVADAYAAVAGVPAGPVGGVPPGPGAGDGAGGGNGVAGMAYRSTLGERLPPDAAALSEAMRAALAAARDEELERGVTQVGPHRDDLLLTLRRGDTPLPVRGYASQGEAWSYAVALRLAAYRLLSAEGVEPVLVLDDVFAELDPARRDRLAHCLTGATQTLVTCAAELDVPDVLRGGARYEVGDGEVKRV
ncbi:MAG TPA: DNA replication/repair protein RecF [Natronosporangium sp.]|nr:DNA replication/repair protein RecF [Natronosporangium sp.]